jgi:GTP-binding protein
VVDTAGLEEAAPGSLAGRMQEQTERALADSDVALLVIDAREGITEADRHFADWLRRSGKPVVLLANKAEGRAVLPAIGEAGADELCGRDTRPSVNHTTSPEYLAQLSVQRRRCEF